MRKVFSVSTALAVALGVLASGLARAHFVLESPPNWAEQDNLGSPQKSAPCGEADAQLTPVPTNAVTTYRAGQAITVTIDEAVFHPGHYRVVLSTSGRAGLPPDPLTTAPGTCAALDIQDPPVFPVLADGMLKHTEAFEGPQSFSVTLPKDVTCTNCTLQVLEFMSAEFGSSPNCFYHHCADIKIAAADEKGDQASCALGRSAQRSSGSAWLAGVLSFGLAKLRRRARARGAP